MQERAFLAQVHGRVEAAFETWGRFVVRRRWSLALVILAASSAVGAFVPHLQFDNSVESFLRQGDPARVHYDAFREQFGQDERILLAIRPPEIFDLAFLERLRALHEEIERDVPYVDEVTSLWNARNTRGEGDELVVEDLMADWPRTEADVATLKARVLDTPFYRDNLVNADSTITAVTLEPFIYSTLSDPGNGDPGNGDPGDGGDALAGFDDSDAGLAEPEFLTDRETNELLAALDVVVARHAAPDFEIHVAGGLVMNRTATIWLMRDLTVFLTVAPPVMALLLFALFRRFSAVVLPVLVVLLAVLVTYGAMAILEIPTSLAGQMLPILVLIVGVCSAVHILTIVYQRLAAGASREDAIAGALGHSGLAITMAALTTAIGLFSFVAAELAQVQNLGLAAPMGIVLAFLFSVTLLPALLAIVPLSSSRFGGDALQRRLGEWLASVGEFAVERPRGVLAVTAVLVLVAGIGASRLRFTQDGLLWFPEHDPMRVSAELLNDRFGGAGGLEMWIDTGREDGLRDPAFLERLDRAIGVAEGLTEGGGELFVGKAVSLLDVVKETHRALHENRPEFYAIPESRELLAQELLLFENSGSDDLEELVDGQFRMTRVSLRTPFADGLLFVPFTQRLEHEAEEVLGEGVDVRVTGLGALLGRTFEAMNTTMARSYTIALLVITPLMVLLIGNLRRGLLSMIPNLVPIWLTLGLMGFHGIPLDNSTMLVGCILIGLAVDDTIHFMHKFGRYYALSGDARRAVRNTLTTTGSALLFTTLVLASGFAVMLLSYMESASDFAKLASFAAVAAFLADLLVAPALMVLATRGEEAAPETLALEPEGAPADASA